MLFPSWRRLVDLYTRRISRLMSGSVIPWDRLAESPQFKAAARRAAEEMVREVAGVNATSWRQAAMKSTYAKQIYKALEAEIDRKGWARELDRIARQNARLIQSVPRDVGRRVAEKAAELQRAGERPAEIERFLRSWAPGLAKSRIELIARTELSRAESNITQKRSEDLGIEYYQWETVNDERVRASHHNLNLVLVPWADPPQPEELIGQHSTLGPGHAGAFPRCRCSALPLVSVDEVAWPARVYRGRSLGIVRMTRPQFVRLVGNRIAA